jgi:hypothetical protein
VNRHLVFNRYRVMGSGLRVEVQGLRIQGMELRGDISGFRA